MKVFSQLEKAQLENTTSDTASHPKGMITYRTDLNQAKVSNGTVYKFLIDEDSTQTLSNKTYASPITSGAITAAQTATPANPSSGSNKLYFKADGKLYTLDAAGNEAMVGSGSGGVKNLITNGNADDSASSIFIPYADAAGTRPVDGTGGSPTVTTSVTTTTPLDGTKSYLLTKPASNVQGQGWAVPFTVDPAYRAKSLKISADYIVNSGTFVAGSNGTSPTDGDLIWTIYDVTNSLIIEPSNIKMFSNSSTVSDKFEATFQTSATGSSYRLIAHVASTSALAFELKVDNITTSPQNYVYGSSDTNWISYTPTGSWVNTNYSGKWRRVGDSMEVQALATLTAAPNATPFAISIPAGYSIDTSKLLSTSPGFSFGTASILDSGTQVYVGSVLYASATTVQLVYAAANGSGANTNNGIVNQANPNTFAVNDQIGISFQVPIVGWESSSRMSDGFDGREVVFSASVTPGTIATSATTWTTLTWSSAIEDSVSGFNGTDTYTVRTAGTYEIQVLASANNAATAYFDVGYRIDGGADTIIGRGVGIAGTAAAVVTGTTKVKLKSGQTIQGRALTQNAEGINLRRITITKIQASQAISATEEIFATYITTSGQTIGASEIVVNFPTKVEDSHNAVSNAGSDFTFTAPAAGLYQTDVILTGGALQTTVDFWGVIEYNGVQKCRDYHYSQSSNGLPKVRPFASERLLAGQTIKIKARGGTSVNLSTNGARECVVSIKRVGL